MITIQEALSKIVELYGQGNLRDAEILCRRILEQEPENPDANHFIAIIACDVGNLSAAKDFLEKAIRLNPNNPSCYLNMGNIVQKEGDLKAAIQWYEKSIQMDYAGSKKAQNNMGVVLTQLGQYDVALDKLKTAIELDPHYHEAHNNIGETYKYLGQYDKALAACEACLKLSPDYVPARWNRSILWFLAGDLESAWPEYEWRWKRGQTPQRKIDSGEKWNGQPFEGRTLFIYEEQGMGDTIQFLRYLPMVQELGGSVIFEVVPPLLRLVEKCKGYDRLWVGQKNVDTRPIDRFDYHFPLMSLPNLFHTTLDTIPCQTPYIEADEELVRIWGNRVNNHQGRKIGIVWAGHPAHQNDRARSIFLSCFSQLKELKNVRLISLQKEKYEKWTDVEPSTLFDQDLGDELSDFADTAAIIQNLDLIISIDTAVVHLAGALGKEVWTLLPFSPDWRWMLEREDTPWYPTMRLFRQPAPGDWGSVINDVKQALISFVDLNEKIV